MKDALMNDNLTFHEELNPILFDSANELKNDVKQKINEIVELFKSYLERDGIELLIDDVVLVGSNASYNYTGRSDIDIHIICKEWDPILLNVYNAYKALFNKSHKIKFNKYPVELYVQPSVMDITSDGIYSMNSGWIKYPTKEKVDNKQIKDINKELKSLFENYKDQINKVLEKPTIEKIDSMLVDIYNLRVSLNLDGEFSIGNLLFKEIRSKGYINKLKNAKIKLENEKLSISNSKGSKKMKDARFVNGTMEEFSPEELVKKVKERQESLHTIRKWGKDTYIIVVGAHGLIETPDKIWVDILDDKKDERIAMKDFDNWEDAIKFMKDFRESVISKSLPEPRKLPHLEKALKELNELGTEEGEEALFDFVYEIDDDSVYIYDVNENYTYYYLDDLNKGLKSIAQEFGKEFKPVEEDKIHDKIEAAIKADLGKDTILEWENLVRMIVGLPEEEHVKDASPELEFAKEHIRGYNNVIENETEIHFQANKNQDENLEADEILEPILNVFEEEDIMDIWFSKKELRELMENK